LNPPKSVAASETFDETARCSEVRLAAEIDRRVKLLPLRNGDAARDKI
jgi:hypothetical protein